MHMNLVLAAAEVELGEVSGAAELVQELINDGNREHVAQSWY